MSGAELDIDAKVEAMFDKADELMIKQKNYSDAVI